MDIVVRGKNRPVSSRLDAAAREKVSRIAKFTHDAGRVEVDFAEQQHRRVAESQLCEITVHLKKHFVKAHACAPEPEAALDLAVDKIGHQVARIKEKRVSRVAPAPAQRCQRQRHADNGAFADGDGDADGEHRRRRRRRGRADRPHQAVHRQAHGSRAKPRCSCSSSATTSTCSPTARPAAPRCCTGATTATSA